MIIDFLKMDIPQEDMRIALDVIRKFKSCEELPDWMNVLFVAWTKLEQLEEYLQHRVEGKPLNEDTLAILDKIASGRMLLEQSNKIIEEHSQQ